jgi:hypothetical protein
MTFKEFNDRNESGRTFSDISTEQVRSYMYAGGSKIEITNPIALHVSKSGHYVADSSGVVTFLPYGPNGWLALQFLSNANGATMKF